jgi:hypothetical protein
VAVHKSLAKLVSADGAVIGEGRAYLHLARPASEPQRAHGTLSLDWWDEERPVQDARLELANGPSLALELESDKLSGCIQGRVLRYTAAWPGT